MKNWNSQLSIVKSVNNELGMVILNLYHIYEFCYAIL